MPGRHGGYLNGSFPEDYELWLRWLDAGVQMAKVPASLLTWNDATNRLSRTDPRYSPAAFAGVKADYLACELRRHLGDRQLWVWGAGRPTRRRAGHLTEHGISIRGYVDIDPSKTGRTIHNRPVISKGKIPSAQEAMIVSFVSNRGATALIRNFLSERGHVEGRDYWMAG